MKRLATAALALALTPGAFAQQGPGTDTQAPQNQPAAQAKSPEQPQKEAGASHFVTNESGGEWLASNLMKKNVYDASGRSIGELRNILIGQDGKVAALVIGVGGFLGIGEKDVAVDYNFVKQEGGFSPNRVVIKMTEQELRSAPVFKPSKSSTQ